jgi:hypothetical protein
MYAWAMKRRRKRSILGEGEDVRKLLGPALFLVRFSCIEPSVIAKEIG